MEMEQLWMKKAEKHLEAGKFLFDVIQSSSIIDISYMAMFSAVKALLIKRGIECKTHEGLLYLFKVNYVDSNLFSRFLFEKFCLCKELKTVYFNSYSDDLSKLVIWQYLNYSRDFLDDAWELI